MNISKIAQLAGVSPATVSRYLNKGYVSAEKRQKIREVIEQTGYSPSPSAQTLRTGRNHLIGVIVPQLSSEPVAKMVDGISDALKDSSYQLLLANTSNDVEKELEFLKIFRNNNVDGVIFMGTMMSPRHTAMMRTYQKPLLLLAQRDENFPCVYFDDFTASYQATEILLQKGCHHIGYLGIALKDRAVGRERRSGYVEALRAYHVPFRPEYVEECAFSPDSGATAVQRLLNKGLPLDGLFCGTDQIAFGAIRRLEEHDLTVPEQVRVIAVDNCKMAELFIPRLSSIDLSHRTGGREAGTILLKMLQDPAYRAESAKMCCQVHRRESSE
jgi:LacI family sucrose operon transcriptional repressor